MAPSDQYVVDPVTGGTTQVDTQVDDTQVDMSVADEQMVQVVPRNEKENKLAETLHALRLSTTGDVPMPVGATVGDLEKKLTEMWAGALSELEYGKLVLYDEKDNALAGDPEQRLGVGVISYDIKTGE